MEERPEVTLVYAHGCSFSKDMWTPVLGRLKKFPVVQRVATKDFGNRHQQPQSSESQRSWMRRRQELVLENNPRAGGRLKTKSTDFLIGVGFSMGSGALWATEVAHPGTFDALILFEPAMDTKTPRTEAMRSFLAASALRRPSSWPSRAAAEEYFTTSEGFSAWDPEVLAAHPSGALLDQPDGSVTLACDPRLEASLYSMTPLHFSDAELQRPKCPIYLHWGSRSQMCFEKNLKAIEKKCPDIYKVREAMPGLKHLVVMENPALTAANIARELEQLAPYRQISKL
ncbi:putative alpha/beta hydrolase fold-1 [Phytophthora infestans]|uniref:Putative alpha/beta hydrolase fold-1 n=1 Tax=Phytophthora infestans TaxID=4787 RepID=A0A8S9UQH9_PHYIN|nr:putative alpha/beta hydrolase fold-1 [Phytophthora infestans]